jgi:hypothetical protein
MSVAHNREEREFWSRQLDTTSIEEAKALPKGFHWIDAEEPRDVPRQRSAEAGSGNRFTLWDV